MTHICLSDFWHVQEWQQNAMKCFLKQYAHTHKKHTAITMKTSPDSSTSRRKKTNGCACSSMRQTECSRNAIYMYKSKQVTRFQYLYRQWKQSMLSGHGLCILYTTSNWLSLPCYRECSVHSTPVVSELSGPSLPSLAIQHENSHRPATDSKVTSSDQSGHIQWALPYQERTKLINWSNVGLWSKRIRINKISFYTSQP